MPESQIRYRHWRDWHWTLILVWLWLVTLVAVLIVNGIRGSW